MARPVSAKRIALCTQTVRTAVGASQFLMYYSPFRVFVAVNDIRSARDERSRLSQKKTAEYDLSSVIMRGIIMDVIFSPTWDLFQIFLI